MARPPRDRRAPRRRGHRCSAPAPRRPHAAGDRRQARARARHREIEGAPRSSATRRGPRSSAGGTCMNDLELLDELLAHPSTWVEPPPDLTDVVVWAVADAAAAAATPRIAPSDTRRNRRRGASLFAVAAALIAALAVGAAVLGGGAATADYEGNLSATGLAPGAHGSVAITHT